MTSGMEARQDQPSGLWFLLPIFLGIIGGLIMYLVLRDQAPKMARMGFWVGLIIFLVTLVGGILIGAAVIFAGPSLFSEQGAGAKIKASNHHLWVSPDGKASAGALVVTNLGSEVTSVTSVKIRGISVPYSAWYYNKADATAANINTQLRADYTPSSVNVDLDQAEEQFRQAAGPVTLNSNESVILYLLSPAQISDYEGLTFTVVVEAEEETAIQSVSVVSAAG